MHKFSPDQGHRLERPERYLLLPPEGILRDLGFASGMHMLDLGAGTGFFSRAASLITGPAGHIYAADIAEPMLDQLRARGLPDNVTTLLSGEFTVPLPDASVHFTLFAFVVHETPDPERLLREAARVTRPEGKIAIIEWIRQEEEHGPPTDERLDAETLAARVRTIFPRVSHRRLNDSHYIMEIFP